MKPKARSSITLPAEELEMVRELKGWLGLESNVEVVRRGLRLLKEQTERAALRTAYRKASEATRGASVTDRDALDHLAADGLDRGARRCRTGWPETPPTARS